MKHPVYPDCPFPITAKINAATSYEQYIKHETLQYKRFSMNI
jgi:hypothetical protein